MINSINRNSLGPPEIDETESQKAAGGRGGGRGKGMKVAPNKIDGGGTGNASKSAFLTKIAGKESIAQLQAALPRAGRKSPPPAVQSIGTKSGNNQNSNGNVGLQLRTLGAGSVLGPEKTASDTANSHEIDDTSGPGKQLMLAQAYDETGKKTTQSEGVNLDVTV